MKKTVTSIFMIPPLGVSRDRLEESGFLNAYIRDVDKDPYEGINVVYLLFKPSDLNLFKDFLEDEYERVKEMIIEEYDHEGGFVVVVYKMDEKFKEDISLIKEGKYSKTSNAFKNRFKNTKTIVKDGKKITSETLQFRVFEKTPEMREYWENLLNITFTEDMEVWTGFDEESETLDINKVKNQLENERVI